MATFEAIAFTIMVHTLTRPANESYLCDRNRSMHAEEE